MKRKIKIFLTFLLSSTCCFAQLTPKEQAMESILDVKDNNNKYITPLIVRRALTDVTNFTSLKVPFVTISDIRSGGADGANVVSVTDSGKEGLFYKVTNPALVDDSSTIISVSSTMKYVFKGDKVTARRFGAVANGIADDLVPIKKAIAYVQKAKIPLDLENYSYVLTANFPIDSSITITGNGATLKASSRIEMQFRKLKLLENVIFDNVAIRFAQTFTDPAIVQNCTFKNNTSFAVYLLGGSNTWPRNIRITGNVFTANSYSIYGGLTNGYIFDNRFSASTNRNIELYAGTNTVIRKNIIDGGITGITQLNSRNITSRMILSNNVVEGNVISNVSEEAISIDCHCNTSAASGSVALLTVASVATTGTDKDITVNQALPAFGYIEYHAVFLNGPNKGEPYRISYMGPAGTNYIRIPTPTGTITSNDSIVVMLANVGGKIINNTISNATSAITLWGNGFKTLIQGNTISNSTTAGISISNLTSVTAGTYSIAEGNIIKDNISLKSAMVSTLRKYGAINYWGKNTFIGNVGNESTLTIDYQSSLLLYNNEIPVSASNIASTLPSAPINTIVNKFETSGDYAPYTSARISGTTSTRKIITGPSASVPNTATSPGGSYVQAEVVSILTELRALKTALNGIGIIP